MLGLRHCQCRPAILSARPSVGRPLVLRQATPQAVSSQGGAPGPSRNPRPQGQQRPYGQGGRGGPGRGGGGRGRGPSGGRGPTSGGRGPASGGRGSFQARPKQGGSGSEFMMNEAIRVPEVRVIGEEREPMGVMSTSQARSMAEELGVDLIMVTPDADPPVCRLVEWSKLKFEKAKAQKETRRKQREGVQDTKELKMRPSTDVHDYQVRLRQAQKFIEKNNKVRLVIQMRGRELQFKEQAEEMMERFKQDMGEEVAVEQPAKLQGRSMVMLLGPKKK